MFPGTLSATVLKKDYTHTIFTLKTHTLIKKYITSVQSKIDEE